jgi:hypothetical protein
MSNRNEMFGLLALLEALRVAPEPFALPSVKEATERLHKRDFTAMPEEAHEAFNAAMREVGDLDLKDVESMFIVVSVRAKRGEPCEGCGEVHDRREGSDKDGTKALVIGMGDIDNIKDLIVTGAEALEERVMRASIQELLGEQDGAIPEGKVN